MQLGKCRRPHNLLGFVYQVAFVRLFRVLKLSPPFAGAAGTLTNLTGRVL